MGRGVNPTFQSQMSTPDHPLHQMMTCQDGGFARLIPLARLTYELFDDITTTTPNSARPSLVGVL